MPTTPLPVRELLQIQLRTLFRLDPLGRLMPPDELERPPAPRIFVGRGEGEKLVRVRQDISEPTVRAWLRCASDDELRRQVSRHEGITREYRGPAFVLPEMDASLSNGAVPVGSESPPLHAELIGRGWMLQETPPYFGAVVDGLVVAVCFSAASSGEAAEAGVETATAYRGRGFVERAIRTWAAAVQRSGRLALYSTTWDNLASRRVAEKLGAFEYGEDWHLT